MFAQLCDSSNFLILKVKSEQCVIGDNPGKT